MVSRETQKNHSQHDLYFVAGILSLSATFFEIKTARHHQYGFQVKLSHENSELLRLVRDIIGINNPIRYYNEGGTQYALLITRSKNTLLQKIIPFMDIYLQGPKLTTYIRWKQSLLKNVIQ